MQSSPFLHSRPRPIIHPTPNLHLLRPDKHLLRSRKILLNCLALHRSLSQIQHRHTTPSTSVPRGFEVPTYSHDPLKTRIPVLDVLELAWNFWIVVECKGELFGHRGHNGMDAVECCEEGGDVGWVDDDFDLEGGRSG